ncbi:MAG: DEAD/DEAH box helicase [Chlamydiia bacterium]
MEIGEVIFSGGTYQVQVHAGADEYWPLLTYADHGQLQDALCSCDHPGCEHLKLARALIEGSRGIPLHVRWKESFWRALGWALAQTFGFDAGPFQKEGDKQFFLTHDGEKIATIVARSAGIKKSLKGLLVDRVAENEENSLKFSHRSAEELAEWRAGHPSGDLRFDLSLWADLTRFCFVEQEKQQLKSLTWGEGKEAPPSSLEIEWLSWSWQQVIRPDMWPFMIPALGTVPSDLKQLHSKHDQAELLFDADAPSLRIALAKGPREELGCAPGMRIASWCYRPGVGFERLGRPVLDRLEAESKEGITRVLQQHAEELARYLKDPPIHLGGVRPIVELQFLEDWSLQVRVSLHKKGDLDHEGVRLYSPWVYLPEGKDRGFWKMEGLPFAQLQTIVPPVEMDDFIARHRTFLNGFPGFTTHLTTIETQLGYRVQPDGSLCFVNLLERQEEKGSRDFGEWVYLPGQGFYAKMNGPLGPLVRVGTVVPIAEVPVFIRNHREDLALVRGFFATENPIEQLGVRIMTQPDHSIVVSPELKLTPGYELEQLRFYGDYIYVQDRGFWELPPGQRLPDEYQKEKRIEPEHTTWFIAKQLEVLRPFALSVDPRLTPIQELEQQIQAMTETPEGWWLQIALQSDLGKVSLVEVWEAIRAQRGYLISDAGLIDLSHPTLHWLRSFPKGRVDPSKGSFQLSQMELMRLSFMGTWDVEGQRRQVRTTLERILTTQTDRPFSTDGFRSQLRPYQQTGLAWLWSLYANHLSALLCDDMGLGKTHQAMGLLSAIAYDRRHPEAAQGVFHTGGQAPLSNRPAEPRFLVVCPTSVIYHWQDQLQRFLPHLKVHTFHGLGRSLEDFARDGHVLLTSYGILRTSKNPFSEFSFDAAIFDELQYAKNASSHTHAALSAIKTRMVVGLTGTPIENNIWELRALFEVVLPGYMPGEAAFRELFVNPIEKHQDVQRRELLTRFIHPFVLRRKKSEVLQDLPEKIEEIAMCELSPEQHRLYQETLIKGREAVLPELMDDVKPIPYMHIFTLLGKLKQICDHPALVLKEVDTYKHHASGKWDLFCELMKEARESGQKVVVFSHFLKMLDLMEEYLKDQVIGFASVRGSTVNRQEELRRFKEDPTCEVFLGSLGAVGVGVDLSSASVVIHYDRWWNAAREEQATDRVHRIGQIRGVQVFKMVTRNTIEESIHKMILRKGALMQDVIRAEDQEVLKKLDRNELMELLHLLEPMSRDKGKTTSRDDE